MSDDTDRRQLARLLDSVFTGQERVTRDEILRRAIAADLPAEARDRLERLPEGEYAQDEVAEALGTGNAI